MNVFLRHITQSVLMVESDIALVVYNHSLGISHGYVQSYMYVAITPSKQMYIIIPMRYHMHSFCVDFYALSVSTCTCILATCTSNNTCKVTIILVIILIIMG